MLRDDMLQRVIAHLSPVESRRKKDRIELVGKYKGVQYRAVVMTEWKDSATWPKTWLMTLFDRRPHQRRKTPPPKPG